MKKKLTRKEWEELELRELEKGERIERNCEKLAITKSTEERLKLARELVKK